MGASKRVYQEISFFFQLALQPLCLQSGVGHATVLWATWTAKFLSSKATWCCALNGRTHRRSSFPRASALPSSPWREFSLSDSAGYNGRVPVALFAWACSQTLALLPEAEFCHFWKTATLVSEKGTPNGQIPCSRLKSEDVNSSTSTIRLLGVLNFPVDSTHTFKKSYPGLKLLKYFQTDQHSLTSASVCSTTLPGFSS